MYFLKNISIEGVNSVSIQGFQKVKSKCHFFLKNFILNFDVPLFSGSLFLGLISK
ncbi:hypothetical protein MARINOS108_120396 [Marinoscillum sp. 108]|nr:hypothetical protein MARINOS108_120396 [Marinoscillum sp. 108]